VTRLLYLLAGLVGGVVVGRNAGPIDSPAQGAVWLALLAGCGLCWVAAYRGKAAAVATAVAVAKAEATATATAAALAQVQVNIGAHDGPQLPAGAVWTDQLLVEQREHIA
jgi:hypothetical protein